MGEDLRIIFIRLADRVHNIQTLHYHPTKEKRERIAEETLRIYVPIAQRLWLAQLQSRLENGAFKILYPKQFSEIYKYVETHFGDNDYSIQWIEKIINVLHQENIHIVDISWRTKSPYRVYKKLVKYKTTDINEIKDIVAFRVIVKDVTACYNTLWVIHKHFTPLIKKIKDYIAIPKSNGYQSLHTSVLWMFPFPVEVQIRTPQMDEQAKFWVAAHFAYKENDKSTAIPMQQWVWINKLQEIVQEYQTIEDKENFNQKLHVELLDKNIFVYTPTGDVIEMPWWSTVLDFAFRIHSDIWLKFKTAQVNQKSVPIDYKLTTWDYVQISSFKNKYTASKSWISSLYLPSSRWKVVRHLKKQERDLYCKKWLHAINKILEQYKLPLIGEKKDIIQKNYKNDERESLLLQLCDKKITPTKLIKEHYPHIKQQEQKASKEKKEQKNIPQSATHDIIVDHTQTHIEHSLCQECTPQPWDKIIAHVKKWSLKIHTLTCDALERINYNRVSEAHWSGEEEAIYYLQITLLIDHAPWSLLSVFEIFSSINVSIHSIHSGESRWDTWVNIIEVEIRNPSKIQLLIKELQKNQRIAKIENKQLL